MNARTIGDPKHRNLVVLQGMAPKREAAEGLRSTRKLVGLGGLKKLASKPEVLRDYLENHYIPDSTFILWMLQDSTPEIKAYIVKRARGVLTEARALRAAGFKQAADSIRRSYRYNLPDNPLFGVLRRYPVGFVLSTEPVGEALSAKTRRLRLLISFGLEIVFAEYARELKKYGITCTCRYTEWLLIY